MQALHSCGVVHADIKTSNVLVYAIQDGYSENWRIKLSDFGNSVPKYKEILETDSIPINGTPMYRAPELDHCSTSSASVENYTAIDIWSWGMLLWEVTNDGGAYKDQSDTLILLDTMRELRVNGGVGTLAYEVCLARIRKKHGEEPSKIRRAVLEAIQSTLQADPQARPSALALLARLQKTLPDEK